MRYSMQIAPTLSAGIAIVSCILLLQCNSAVQSKKVTPITDTAAVKLLGHYLFYDRRLSVNYTRACATCHNPQFAFTDGYKRSIGAFADLHQRNSTPLFNLQYYRYLTAADSSLHLLTQQMDQPLFNQHPVEMGAKGHEAEILMRLKSDSLYGFLFSNAFPSVSNPVSWANVKTAISNFVQGLQSFDSPYDRYINGDSNAISSTQIEGMKLFFSARFKCVSCHGGQNFSEPSVATSNGRRVYYFNTGLYNINSKGAYPDYDQGLYQRTKKAPDMGSFRVPTLRNLVFTAPYFHDGSAATIKDAVAVFLEGGRNIGAGLYKGDGTKNPFKDALLITKVNATQQEKAALIDFIYSLSDSAFLQNKAFLNPFTEDETKKK